MRNNIIAIMYDFDKTLCTRDMQEYTFFPNLGIEAADFWNDANKLRENNKMDQVLSYMYLMFRKTVDNNRSLKKDYLRQMGENIELFPGLDDWFERINEYGRSLGFEIEHYIISSGVKDIIEGSSIAEEFKNIYACEYMFSERGTAIWPKVAINYTMKTQYVFRISKGVDSLNDDAFVNSKVAEADRRVLYRNMIYFGDGITDVPCMRLIKDKNGKSIAVYPRGKKDKVASLLRDDRVNYIALADYSENSELENIVKLQMEYIALLTKMEEKEKKQLNSIKPKEEE